MTNPRVIYQADTAQDQVIIDNMASDIIELKLALEGVLELGHDDGGESVLENARAVLWRVGGGK